MPHDSFAVDEKGPAVVHRPVSEEFLTEDAKCPCRLPVPVAQELDVELELFGEDIVREGGVRADPDDRRARGLKLGRQVPKLGQLQSSALGVVAGEVEQVKGDDEWSVGEELVARYHAARTADEDERRNLVASNEGHCALLPIGT